MAGFFLVANIKRFRHFIFINAYFFFLENFEYFADKLATIYRRLRMFMIFVKTTLSLAAAQQVLFSHWTVSTRS